MKNKIPFSFRIAIVYIVLGALWILFSDRMVLNITEDPIQIQQISTYKGWFYVVTTGILLFFLIRREIRRRNEVTLQLQIEKKKAEEADRLKTAFLSNLSHYIRTPMNSILGFAELLQESDLDEENQHVFLSYIHERSYHLLNTLNNIIEISKIQEGQLTLNYKPFSMNNLIDTLHQTANLELIQKNKPVVLEIHKELENEDDLLNSDREKVMQILSTLLSNAINFTTTGKIDIGYQLQNNSVHFYVSDTGKGIAEETQKTLFTNYLYHTSATCNVGEGAGLSLFLAAGLSKLLGGTLRLEWSSPHGSKFCLSIPMNS